MTSDDDDDGESFFTYGEPLDDDEDGPKLNLTAVENQVVKDEQGRRRFHGAFTGGFSAGYFNSVGSKEGWTPSTFVSSRSNKNEGKKNQIAEDFMDDEDLGEYGIAPRKLKTADKFTSSARVPKRSGDDETSTIPGLAPLNDLVTVTNASIGAQILKRMGWREGQGVGPKVRKYKKKKSKGKLGNKDEQGGESIPTSEAEKCEDEMSNFLFGPDDVQQFLFQMKSDQKGLGYSGINRDTSVLGGHMNLFGDAPPVKGKRKGIKGSAFGIGAFEEQDDDIYSTDDMNMYDQVLGGEDQSERNFGWTAPKTTASSHCCLDGFTAASQTKALVKKVFAPPILPSGFQPIHTFSEVEPPKGVERYSRFSLSSNQRSAMLGEEVLPGKPTTPENKLSDRQESRMEFGRDEKQQHNKKQEGDEQSIPQGITEWERQRGRSELTRAAGLHKPVSSMMASRFVSAQYKDEEVVQYGETNQEDKSQHENAAEMKMYGKLTRELFEWHPDNLLCKRFNVPNPYPGSSLVGVPTMQKEKVSVYNFLTKTTSLDEVSVPAITAPTSISVPSVLSERSDNGSLAPQSESSKRKKKSRWDIKPAILSIIEERRKNVTSDKNEPETNEEGEEETENRPPRDLFNAIFNESDSSDSESSGSDSGRDDDDQEGKTKGSEEPEDVIPVKDEKDPGKLEANFLENTSRDGEDQSKECISEEDELYGPALPPASSPVPTHVHYSGREGASISEAGKKHSRHSHGSRHRKKHQRHSSESRSSSKKTKSQSSSRKEKKRKRRKEKKHRKESHRGRSSRDKQKKRSNKSSDSSYSSASEG